ncbi:antiholin protein [Serratia phage vB_SmaM-Susuwatari]|nr:antiholin protein [Serratia phage vB_SmaM-Susuwatari]
MQEPTSLWQMFMLYRKELGFSALAATIAVLCSWHRRERGREIFFNGIMAGIVGMFIEDLINVFGLSPKAATFACIMVGYIGATAIMDKVSEKFPILGSKKAEPKPDGQPSQQVKEEK